jgi:thiol-disulfide isomerase/thioredoxin
MGGAGAAAACSLLGVMLTVTASSCATGGGDSAGASAGGGGNQVGQQAPDLTVEKMSGKSVSVASYRGQVLLLDVWASWCGPCKQELPMLDDIAARLRSRGVEILAVSVDQERANVVKFLGARDRWALTIAHDPAGEVAERLQPEKMPTSYIIDRQGIIRYVNYGFVPSDARKIESRLSDLAAASATDGDGAQPGRSGKRR